jgi:hypothetical protein
MELKTESGVLITIIEDGSSKVLIFDKSVRAVGLSKEETSKISALLSSTSNANGALSTKAGELKQKRSATPGDR